jgi:glycosyltransferase involved in cell wall biosynthesis
MDKLRVIHIIPSLLKGGAERLTLDICTSLNANEDVECMLVTLKPINYYSDDGYSQRVVYCNSKVVPSLTSKSLIDIVELQNFISDYKPHIIHTHLFEAEITAREVHYPNAAWFSHLHDNMFQFKNMSLADWLNKRRITEFFEKSWMIKRYRKSRNAFIAISKNAQSFFQQTLPKDLQHITLLHNAIDCSRFESPEAVMPSGNIISMATTGSLVDKKNQIFLVDVVKELNKRNYKARLDILGDGINRERIQNAVDANSLNEQIILHGNVAKVEDYLKKVSFYVHPAYYEPFGLVLLEAMAASKVCVSLNGKGNLDIHREGKNGFLIDPANASAFAEKLIEIAQNQEQFKQIAAFSHEFAKDYDIQKYSTKLLEIYLARRKELGLSSAL